MKEDYLWDKTGEDAQIEALENALAAFRSIENAPPELPQKVFTVEKAKARRRFFQFGFGFASLAAFATALIIFSFAWLQTGDAEMTAAGEVREIDAPHRPGKIAGDSFIDTGKPEDFKPPANPSSETRPIAVKIRRPASAPVIRRSKPEAPSKKSPEPSQTLTAEEKYAYDQLMLALSITGSKLKIVQDKVKGIDDQNAVLETAK
jgi:hypothetical protein